MVMDQSAATSSRKDQTTAHQQGQARSRWTSRCSVPPPTPPLDRPPCLEPVQQRRCSDRGAQRWPPRPARHHRRVLETEKGFNSSRAPDLGVGVRSSGGEPRWRVACAPLTALPDDESAPVPPSRTRPSRPGAPGGVPSAVANTWLTGASRTCPTQPVYRNPMTWRTEIARNPQRHECHYGPAACMRPSVTGPGWAWDRTNRGEWDLPGAPPARRAPVYHGCRAGGGTWAA
jgi:hypothetical protein